MITKTASIVGFGRVSDHIIMRSLVEGDGGLVRLVVLRRISIRIRIR